MVDSVAVEESADDESSPTLKIREKNSKSTKIKTKSDYFGSLLRESGRKKTKMKVVHTTKEIDQVSSLCYIYICLK